MALTKRLVIVGGSYGGLRAIEHITGLKLDLEIVLMSPNSSVFFNVSSPRVLVEIENVEKMFFPIKDFLETRCRGIPKFVQAKATDIDLSQHKLFYQHKYDNQPQDSGDEQQMSYDFLLISTGTHGDINGFQLNDNSHLDSIKDLKQINSQLQNNKQIAIIGGGPTGVEIAGEIKGKYPDKEVTIYGNKEYIVHSMGSEFSRKLVSKLTELGVRIVNEKQFQQFDGVNKTLKFKDGEQINADMVIMTKSTPNSKFLSKYPQHLNEKKYILVDDHLNLAGHDNVWVIGDVLATSNKNIYDIMRCHVPYVAESLKKHLSNRPITKPFKGTQPVIALPVHKSGGVGSFGGWNLPSWLVYYTKGRDYFLSGAKRHFG